MRSLHFKCYFNSIRPVDICKTHYLRNSYEIKSFSRCSSNSKIFQTENKYAHNVMASLPKYSKTTIEADQLTLEFSQATMEELKGGKFEEPTLKLCNNEFNVMFLQLLEDFKSCDGAEKESNLINVAIKLSKFAALATDDSIMRCLLYSIPVLCIEPTISNKFTTLYNTLSHECIRRAKFWSVNQVLLVADIWDAINCNSSFRYHYSAIKLLHDNLKLLTPQQVVQFLFYVNRVRDYKLTLTSFNLENKISEILDFIEIEELGIIAMGLFKSKNIITDILLLRRIINITQLELERISEISLCAMLKLLRLSFTGLNSEHFKICSLFLKEIKPHIKNLNSFCLIHLASIGNQLLLYEEEILNEIIDNLVPHISVLRLKDLERILYVLMNSRITPKNHFKFYHLIEEELMSLKRQSEIKEYPFSFLSCVYYSTCIGNCSSTLISDALKINQEFITENKLAVKQLHQLRLHHLFNLDLELEVGKLDGYKGYRLPGDYSLLLRKMFLSSNPLRSKKPSKHEQVFIQVQKLMAELLGKEQLNISFILPNISVPDIIFCTNQKCVPVKFPSSFSKYSAEDVKYPLLSKENKLTWNVIVAASSNKHYIHNTGKLCGSYASRLRLLNNMGYKVTVISSQILASKEPIEQLKSILEALTQSSLSKEWLSESLEQIKK